MHPKHSTNHSTSRNYEALVATVISQEMKGLSGVHGLEIKQDTKLKGLSGYEHQIDVHYKFRLWKTEFLVIVECKQYQKNVGVDDLLEFRSRIEDLRAHKGVFITSVGFQSGAAAFASANRIALLVIRGTQVFDVQYSLLHISDEKRCLILLSELKAPYQALGGLIDGRLRIAPDSSCVEAERDGAKVTFTPRELRLSMLYRHQCQYEENQKGYFFEAEHCDHLQPTQLLKIIVLHELITSEIGA